jgi:hypothetical protein
MVSWCNGRSITFTRSRAYRKNDQAHVEEKNGSVVRRLVGYDRFEGESARGCLEELYRFARLYINFFQPSMKLMSKKRDGAKVSKRYDTARTPVARLLDSPNIPNTVKSRLRSDFAKIDPMALLADMAKLQTKLWTFAVGKNGDQQPRTFPVEVTEAVPQRAKRKKKRFNKRPLDTRTAKIYEAVLTLPYGTPVEAKQFYDIGSIHFVNATLHTFWKRDRIIARPAFGKYVRINPNDADDMKHIIGKRTKK